VEDNSLVFGLILLLWVLWSCWLFVGGYLVGAYSLSDCSHLFTWSLLVDSLAVGWSYHYLRSTFIFCGVFGSSCIGKVEVV
jgi:hypothetical protein